MSVLPPTRMMVDEPDPPGRWNDKEDAMQPNLIYELMKPYLEQRFGGIWADYHRPTHTRHQTNRRHERHARPTRRS